MVLALSLLGGGVLLVVLLKVYTRLTLGRCYSKETLTGKTVIVTGANSGIGYECALDFARRGARVILACRSAPKADKARDKIIASTDNQDVHVRLVDMLSLQSVRDFARDILASERRIDVLVNNAGVGGLGANKTKDGLHPSVQCNHFGPFLLTNLLLGRIKESAPSRIVTVSSGLYFMAKFDVDDINLDKGNYSEFITYANTKLLNIFMSNELARKLSGTGVTSNSLHPGVVITSFLDAYPILRTVYYTLLGAFFKTPEEGAQTHIYLAVDKSVEKITGKYFEDCHEVNLKGISSDPALAMKVWDISEQLVQLKDSEKHY